MKKILLTAGSSFSYDFFNREDELPAPLEFKKWPALLADRLDFDLINISKPGASNIFIYDHLMENIIRHGDNIGLIVASWTYGFKTSVFRNYELNFLNINDQDMGDPALVSPATILKDKIISDGLLISSIEQTMRLMIYLQDTCDAKGIKCIHYPLLNIFKSGLEKTAHIKFIEQITYSENFSKIQKFNNTIGWPCDVYLGGYTFNTAHKGKTISDKDRHPNEEGQKIIAAEIYDKYIQI